MAALDCCFVTFNCGRELINTSYFASNLFDLLQKRNAPPDLIILALEEIAPIGYSFLGGSFLTPYFNRLQDAINESTKKWSQPAARYENILQSNAGMTALMLFAKPDVARSIAWIETAGVGVGNQDLGNKGAIGVRLGYGLDEEDETEMTFVSAHLAPMEDACERRNNDWKAINENMVFTRLSTPAPSKTRHKTGDTIATAEAEPLLSSATDAGMSSQQRFRDGLIKPNSHLFLAGDLNYRTADKPPGEEDHRNWPQPTRETTDAKHYSNLFRNDQLTRELKSGRTLHYLQEAPVTFPPTYKYSSQAQEQAAEIARYDFKAGTNTRDSSRPPPYEQSQWHWAKHRNPSWCDRILYLNPPFPGTQPTIHEYTSLPVQPTSDHQPVGMLFSIPLKPLPKPNPGEEAWVKPPFPVRSDWKQKRETARRREIAVGVFSYLALTWEGEALLLGTVLGALGAWALLRSLLI